MLGVWGAVNPGPCRFGMGRLVPALPTELPSRGRQQTGLDLECALKYATGRGEVGSQFSQASLTKSLLLFPLHKLCGVDFRGPGPSLRIVCAVGLKECLPRRK